MAFFILLDRMPFLKSSDKRWTALLDEVNFDLYHLPGFSEIEAKLIGGEATAWYHQQGSSKVLIPFVKRAINSSSFYDLVSPYGYSGLICNRDIVQNQFGQLLRAYVQEAREHTIVSSFIRLNPLHNQWKMETETTKEKINCRQWYHGYTVSIDLSLKRDFIQDSYSYNHKRNLKRLLALGFQTQINNWDHESNFINAYMQTMKRRNALPYYFFPDEYFRRLKELLGKRLVLISICNKENEFVAGGLFTLFGTIMQYHLGATVDNYVSLSPSKLMIDSAIDYGLNNGASLLHLGGGVGGSSSDGLFRFKKGFGQHFHRFSTLRFIHNKKAYESLKKKSKVSMDNQFFPAYRKV